MKITQILFLTLFLNYLSFGQSAEKIVVHKNDPYNLYYFDGTDSTLFYLKFAPKTKPIGCLVILPSMGELVESVTSQIDLHKLAVKKGLLVIVPSINWGTRKFDEEHKFLDTIFKDVVIKHKIPKDKFIIGGLSNGGMVALSYAEKANREKNGTFIIPNAIFALDSPLDYINLYKQAQRDVERNYSEVAVNEGIWLMNMYKSEFGGSPDSVHSEYVKYSIYTYEDKNGGNAKYLLKTPVRIYTEPGIEWQIKNRHRDLYDLNCTDISAMINFLQMKGNSNAEIVVTQDKGVRLDGTKHPHSWSIMDSKDCLNWIIKQLK